MIIKDKMLFEWQKPSVEELISLYISVGQWAHEANRDELIKALSNSSLSLTARNQEMRLIGSCRAVTDFQSICCIVGLVVIPEYQTQSFGKKLVQMIVNKAGGKNRIQTVVVSEEPAIGFYKKIGFSNENNLLIL